jgi:hypothetical protein
VPVATRTDIGADIAIKGIPGNDKHHSGGVGQGTLVISSGSSLIVRGVNNPSAEVVLHIEELLESKNMSVRTRKDSQDDDEPLDHLNGEAYTLSEAKEMIDTLRAELKSKPAASSSLAQTTTEPSSHVMLPTPAPKPAIPEPAPPVAKPTQPSGSTSIADIGRNTMTVRRETPITALDHLRVQLNQASTEEEKGILYRKIKALEAEQRGPRPHARLRGV